MRFCLKWISRRLGAQSGPEDDLSGAKPIAWAHRLGADGAAIGFPLLGPSDKLLKQAGGNSGEQRHD